MNEHDASAASTNTCKGERMFAQEMQTAGQSTSSKQSSKQRHVAKSFLRTRKEGETLCVSEDPLGHLIRVSNKY
jgi:hypothetical protein